MPTCAEKETQQRELVKKFLHENQKLSVHNMLKEEISIDCQPSIQRFDFYKVTKLL